MDGAGAQTDKRPKVHAQDAIFDCKARASTAVRLT